MKQLYLEDFSSLSQLKEEFYRLLSASFSSNQDIFHSDSMDSFWERQRFLLEQVINLQKKEQKEILCLQKERNLKNLSFPKETFCQEDMYFVGEEIEEYFFVGDIHSDTYVLSHILEKIDFFKKVFTKESFRVIFLGDYVDRGKNHIKTLELILALKYHFPKQILLLMGNHDIGNFDGTEVTLYLRKVEKDQDYFYYHLKALYDHFPSFDMDLVNQYLTFLNQLPFTAFIQTKTSIIQAVHGGIPRPSEGFSHIPHLAALSENQPDSYGFTNKEYMLWSDPTEESERILIPKKRFKFYEDEFNAYGDTFGVDFLIRGHQVAKNGIYTLFHNRLYTVFSSGHIGVGENNQNTDTHYTSVSPKVLCYKQSENQFIPLSL